MTEIRRRRFLQETLAGGALASLAGLSAAGEQQQPDSPNPGEGIALEGCPALERALKIAAGIYPKRRRKDLKSLTDGDGHDYRMSLSTRLSICMSPDLTFALFGSRFLSDDRYLRTLRAHLDWLPRNMRLNGKFFINEDLLAGTGRVMSQVMYLIWVWELYLATGDRELIRRHHQPVLRCLRYIESRTDRQGIVNQVDHDDWQLSEGADWVDWCAERMEGSTCVYHTWYARALEHCVEIFRLAGDSKGQEMARDRLRRQRRVLDDHFWNGKAYYDNLNFAGMKVDNFWCDSQIWPIAFGYASAEQAATIFGRIDAEPEMFEGMPMRWCAPLPEEKQYKRRDGELREPPLRPYSWFGRLGAGDVLARCATGQSDHAYKLLDRYARVVADCGTFPECVDMQGKPSGTYCASDYLEHAGGLLLATGRGLLGIDDTAAGTLVWKPRLPRQAVRVALPYWHLGHCWRFGYNDGAYWIDPAGAHGTVTFQLGEKQKQLTLTGEKLVVEI